MATAIETIRYTIRATYGLENIAAQRVKRVGEELREAITALMMDYHERSKIAN